VVYNQAPYLRQCLDGLVSQKTTFPYEIIIHDDASTDGSVDIIREYLNRFPDKIHAVFQTENQFSQKKEIWANYLIPKATGKYLTFCEGDDYWCDSNKLQLQVDFMEHNPDVTICYHQFREYDQAKQAFESYENPAPKDGLTVKELLWGGYLHTTTLMCRKNDRAEKKRLGIGWVMCMDIVTLYLYMDQGRIAGIPGYMSVFRKNTGIWSRGIWYRKTMENIIMLAKLRSTIERDDLLISIDIWCDELKEMIMKAMSEWDGNRKSKAYRLGKIILMPFNRIRHMINTCITKTFIN
jgi:glycosyltransferase involved in cell wall biosynthesis